MKNRFLVILSLSCIHWLQSCDKFVAKNAIDGIRSHRQIGVWCPVDHKDAFANAGDSLIMFTEEHGNVGAYSLIIGINHEKNYDATFYETDQLNALYNVTDTVPGVEIFFEAITFKMNPKELTKVVNRLDTLFYETKPDSYVNALDGWSFLITRNGETKKVNTGPMVDKWKQYSIFLQDSVIRRFKELKRRVQLEANTQPGLK